MATPKYEKLREQYKPDHIKWLLITESPPPDDDNDMGTRHFYTDGRTENDRLYWNTMRAIYPAAKDLSGGGLAKEKPQWLKRFKNDGYYLIESLEQSLPHGTKTSERHKAIKAGVPNLITKIKALGATDAKIILIKSTTFKMATEGLRAAGLNVLNETFVDYPGYWREQQFVDKLAHLIKRSA